MTGEVISLLFLEHDNSSSLSYFDNSGTQSENAPHHTIVFYTLDIMYRILKKFPSGGRPEAGVFGATK